MRSVTQNFGVTYDARPESVAEARAAVSEFAEHVGASPDQVHSVRLAVSEAVTNAVLHAYRGTPGPIHVTAGLADNELRIVVADEGIGMEPKAERPGLGLGIGLIAQVCDDMAVASRAAGGVEVRMMLRVPVASGSRRSRRRSAGIPAAPAEMAVGARREAATVPSAPAE